jgi:hypothetical protein
MVDFQVLDSVFDNQAYSTPKQRKHDCLNNAELVQVECVHD